MRRTFLDEVRLPPQREPFGAVFASSLMLQTMPIPPSAERASLTNRDDCLAALDRVRRFDRLSTVEHLVSHLAHQLGSPLNVIDGRASMVASGQIVGDDIPRQARIIAEQSARMTEMLREIVTFCRCRTKTATDVDLRNLAQSAVAMLGPIASVRQAQIAFDTADARPGAMSIHGNPDSLLVAITHLLENGLRATPERGDSEGQDSYGAAAG